VPSYGTAVMLGFALATWLAIRQAARLADPAGAGQGGAPDSGALAITRTDLLDLAFYLLVFGVVGSRLLFVLLNAGDFARLCAGSGDPRPFARAASDCLAPLKIWDGGLVFYGGLLAAAAVTARFVRRRRWSFGVVGDLFAPGLALGHAIGRLGCLGAGCCFGKACAAAGIPCAAFPPGSVAYTHLASFAHLPAGAAATPPLHPTQLYESAALLALFFVLILWRRRQRFHGQLFLIYLLGYGLLRVAIELFRGDATRRFLFRLESPTLARAISLPPDEPLALSTSQALGVAVALLAATLLWRRLRDLRAPGPPAAAPNPR
jgi:phosphatidylglycerol:prolipoprotein diacylglycerol transferase